MNQLLTLEKLFKEIEDKFEPEQSDCCCGTGKWCDCWKNFKEKYGVFEDKE